MVGNDVVDLRDPDSDANSHPRRFDERVFSSAERQLLSDSRDPSRLRWQLWAAKEAAFKAARRMDASAIFSPPRFEVEMHSPDAGRVAHRRQAAPLEYFDCRWWCSRDMVHAVASAEGAWSATGSAELVHGVRRLESAEPASGPSQAVRVFARERLGAALGVSEASLEIRRCGRIPALWWEGRALAAELSLSHHGDWIAFACRIQPLAAMAWSRPGSAAQRCTA